MAEGNDPLYWSLFQGKSIVQASVDESDGETGSRSPGTPLLRTISAFGSEFRLKCPICYLDLKQPRQLICYDIFCSECLKSLIEESEDSRITCPKCQHRCSVDEISRAVSSDTYLHAFDGQFSVYTESGSVLCNDDHDPPVEAVYFCLECGHNFCENCHVNHADMEECRTHHSLRLFKTSSTMTVGLNRERQDELENRTIMYKCPVCRNTDICEHEQWLNDLQSAEFLLNDECPIPEHADGKKLIAYCKKCEVPICRNCSMIEHKDHITVNISKAKDETLSNLKSLKKHLSNQQDIFKDAANAADLAKFRFKEHIVKVEQEMIERKGAVQTKVEESFNVAFKLIEQTGVKQLEQLKQNEEMHSKAEFMNVAVSLAEDALRDENKSLKILRVWKGLNVIFNDMHGNKHKLAVHSDFVTPQEVVEKRLVLPSLYCMNPDLRILQKVGVEGTILHKSFQLKAEDEVFLLYSILPLTETEALLSCKTQAFISEVVQYSNVMQQRHSIRLPDDGQYSIIAVPGNGIVTTLYQAPNASPTGDCKGKKQILFWDQVLDSMTELDAKGASSKLRVVTETELPPRGVAVTRDSHLVVCTAEDPPCGDCETGRGSILIMTMRGEILNRKDFTSLCSGPCSGPYFPRYITVNINGDICVTDVKGQSVIILNSLLKPVCHIKDPYERQELSKNFCPMGICHDSFGRLIVADSYNNAVLRLEYYGGGQVPKSEIILEDGKNKVSNLSSPTLVAFGPGSKLWVVCRDNVQAFDYLQ